MELTDQEKHFLELIEKNISVKSIKDNMILTAVQYKELLFKCAEYLNWKSKLYTQKLEERKKKADDMWRRIEEYIWIFNNLKVPAPHHLEEEYHNLIVEYASFDIYNQEEI